MPSKWTRWIPAALVPVVAAAGVVLIPMAADATPALPEKSPEQLLEFIAGSADAQYSGTVEQSSNLGLPDLSSLGSSYGGGAGSDSSVSAAMELLTGSNSARVFVGGADTARIQVTDTLAERNVIRNGAEVWTYDSKTNEVQHVTATPGTKPDTGVTTTPAELATRLIDGIEPSTDVTVTETARVAGRAVYQLVLTPDDDATLVGSVILSVDSETGLPLDVRVFADGQSDAAFSVGFSSIDFGAQDAALFSFTPPAGATVTEKEITENELDGHSETAPDEFTKPEVTGAGWSSIIELPAGTASDLGDSSAAAMLGQVLVPVTGGQALETSLVSVLITDDGRVLTGAVGIDQLQAAAAQ
ncbi:outer membrane lipoprotein-sorting protein [Salinibacterium sp. CAN_S4]|uniref:LolA family protein n=1 Tax=Salinibacterium sp. CAN_S4 TaxID=2787727 RepID=UPI0018F03502